CTVASPGTGSMRLVDGSVTLQPDTVTMTRFGVERRSTVGPEAGVRVAWLWDGQVPDGDVVLRLVLTGAAGAPERVVDHTMRDGIIQPGAGVPTGDVSTEVLLPLSTI